MFLRETSETTEYEKTSKFGKLIRYKRTKTLTHWCCDNCESLFTKVKNGPYKVDCKSYCKKCVSDIGVMKLASMASVASRGINNDTKVGQVVTGKDGYPEVYIGKNYPYRPGGYRSIREHVFVMETHLCRRIEKGEIVHHIDGNKRNNSLSNLFLTTVAEHNKLHASSEGIIFDLVRQGVVIFNRDTARYELAKSFNV